MRRLWNALRPTPEQFVAQLNLQNRARVIVDDRELDMRDFGRLLSTYSGWGMRIVFVPDDEIDEEPAGEVREPDDERLDGDDSAGPRSSP